MTRELRAASIGAMLPVSALAPVTRDANAVPRLSWLDTFRGAAVVLMIETHVANTFLEADLRGTAWFTALTYLNGLVAPSFLFIAGFVQGAGWKGGLGKPVSFWRRAQRLGWIAWIGYGLHFPFPQLWKGDWAGAIWQGTQVDVLPCLAVSLLVLLALTWGAQRLPVAWRSGVWWGVLGSLAFGVIVASPVMTNWPALSVPIPLRAFLNASTGSLFPLFSWSAFVFCGAICGAMARLPVTLRLLAMLVVVGLGQTIPSASFSAMSPEFFFERLGWVMGLAMLCEWLLRDRPNPDSWLSFAGRESLVMYVAHLCLIFYSADAGVLPEMELPVGATLAWTAVVMLFTFAIALAKSRWQSASARLVPA